MPPAMKAWSPNHWITCKSPLIVLIVVMVSGVCTYGVTYVAVHFKCVPFIVSQLYHTKIAKTKVGGEESTPPVLRLPSLLVCSPRIIQALRETLGEYKGKE